MFGVRTLRIRSSLLASAVAVATVAAAVAAGTANPPETAVKTAVKGDRLPMPVQMPVQVNCAGADCAPPAPPSYRTDVQHDRAVGITTLTRIPTITD